MRLRLAFRRQMKPVAALLGRNAKEMTHEDELPHEFSRTHTAVCPNFFQALSHPCPLLGWPLRNKNPIFTLLLAANFFLHCLFYSLFARALCWLSLDSVWEHKTFFLFSCCIYCLLFLTCRTCLMERQDKNQQNSLTLDKSSKFTKAVFSILYLDPPDTCSCGWGSLFLLCLLS